MARRRGTPSSDGANNEIRERQVLLPTDEATLKGVMAVPPNPQGVVLFIHANGDPHVIPYSGYLARVLQQAGFATLLVDLLTDEENAQGRSLLDISLLTRRAQQAAAWLKQQPETRDLCLGFFGTSSGAAAAVQAAVRGDSHVRAIASRGGRLDLAVSSLSMVQVPTLLIVGQEDEEAIEMNQMAFNLLQCEKKFSIVPGANQPLHLEAPGAPEEVAQLTLDWFRLHLCGPMEQAA